MTTLCELDSSSVEKKPRNTGSRERESGRTMSDAQVCVKRVLLVESVFPMGEGVQALPFELL